MRRSIGRYRVSIFGAAMLAAIGPVAAAEQLSPDTQLRLDVSEVVACLLKTEYRPLVVSYVTERRGNIGKVTNSDCYRKLAGGRFGRPGVMLDGDLLIGIASELLLRELDLAELDAELAAAPTIQRHEPMTVEKLSPDSRMSNKEKQAWVEQVNHKYQADMIGECVVRKNPVQARQLFLSDHGSSAEREALNLVAPTAQECALDAGVTADLRLLRIYLASNYARLAALADPSLKEKLL